MKIGQTPEMPGGLSPGAAAKSQGKAVPAASTGAAPAGSAAAAAAVAKAAQGLDNAARVQGDFDAGKVKAVRAAIENGTFKVDAEVVADKMLANSQEFLSRTKI
ncbi:MAG: flagellar biosynthesis anti-sigma factor FlgM [Burkholderiaceae bacterium]|nr:flagellar biosynthesis anti-sigma factor FlgM [Burkholderiaceae bacterium]